MFPCSWLSTAIVKPIKVYMGASQLFSSVFFQAITYYTFWSNGKQRLFYLKSIYKHYQKNLMSYSSNVPSTLSRLVSMSTARSFNILIQPKDYSIRQSTSKQIIMSITREYLILITIHVVCRLNTYSFLCVRMLTKQVISKFKTDQVHLM